MPIFVTLDHILTGGKLINTGAAAPLNWVVVSYMVAMGVVTGFIVGAMAEGRGKTLAAIAQFLPLVLMLVLSLVLNRELLYQEYLAGTGQERAATWTWIGLIPAIISGHYGQRYTKKLRIVFARSAEIEESQLLEDTHFLEDR